jgi:hypothetical protein
VLLSLTFTKFIITTYRIDFLLLALLCVTWVNQYVAIVFSYLLTVRILYSVCVFNHSTRLRRILFTVTFALSIHFLIKKIEVEVPILHVLSNILIVIGLITIIKISRLRYMLLIWVIIHYTYYHFEQATIDFSDLQMYFPAIFANRIYTCVNSNVLELALPVCFSLFFTRFSKQSSQTRNVYLMMHFVVFLSVGTYNSIMQMRDTPYDSPVLLTLNGIIVVSLIVSLIEGNFRRLVQYRIML